MGCVADGCFLQQTCIAGTIPRCLHFTRDDPSVCIRTQICGRAMGRRTGLKGDWIPNVAVYATSRRGWMGDRDWPSGWSATGMVRSSSDGERNLSGTVGVGSLQNATPALTVSTCSHLPRMGNSTIVRLFFSSFPSRAVGGFGGSRSESSSRKVSMAQMVVCGPIEQPLS